MGSGANQTLLKDIADQTGGIYQYSPTSDKLWDIYNQILVKVYGQTVVRTASGMVAPGGTVEENVMIDSTIGQATFSLSWPGSDLDLVLVRPDGSTIDPAVAEIDPNITFISGATYELYQVDAPQYGEWTLRINGVSTPPEGEEYSISVFANDAMIFSVAPDQSEYYPGSPIKITASIEDSFLDVIEPQYILGAAMQVTAEDPALNSYSFDLYDDGLHGDGGADDGIYASTFTNTSLLGSYNFDLSVSGANLRDGQPFTREYSFSTLVVEAPEETLFADGFESGDLSAWSSSVTDGGDLSVTAQAAMAGSYGLQTLIDDWNPIYVWDDSPELESQYYASFQFDPNSVSIATNKSHAIFSAVNTAYPPVVKLAFGWFNGGYSLQARAFDEGTNSYRVSPLVAISDAPHTVEIYWQAASAEGANDGQLIFRIDGVEYADITTLDNETQRVNYVQLGAVSGLEASTSSITFFDAFDSRREAPGDMLSAGAPSQESGDAGAVTGDETEVMDDFTEY